jgi:hypothetical protein
VPGQGAQDAPYVHDPSAIPSAAQLVDQAYESAGQRDVADCLRAQAVGAGADPDEPTVRELILAASYRLWLNHGGEAGCELLSATPAGDASWPPLISKVPAAVVDLWRDGLCDLIAGRYPETVGSI